MALPFSTIVIRAHHLLSGPFGSILLLDDSDYGVICGIIVKAHLCFAASPLCRLVILMGEGSQAGGHQFPNPWKACIRGCYSFLPSHCGQTQALPGVLPGFFLVKSISFRFS